MLVLVGAALALAWSGAGQLRGEMTPSGVMFRTVQPGSGPAIKAVDGVMIDYEGRLIDGTVFDTSEGRGPAPMIVGQVIPGFAEALQMMQKGGRYAIRIPAALAYGATPPPGPIPPNSDLEFDVHVVQVVPDAALMAAARQPPQGSQQPAPQDMPQP